MLKGDLAPPDTPLYELQILAVQLMLSAPGSALEELLETERFAGAPGPPRG